jgi:hypothetical protein
VRNAHQPPWQRLGQPGVRRKVLETTSGSFSETLTGLDPHQVSMLLSRLPSSLTLKQNKLECSFISGQVYFL